MLDKHRPILVRPCASASFRREATSELKQGLVLNTRPRKANLNRAARMMRDLEIMMSGKRWKETGFFLVFSLFYKILKFYMLEWNGDY